MTAARTKTRPRGEVRLLHAAPRKGGVSIEHLKYSDLPRLLGAGDVVVINDAATLPASFSGVHVPTGRSVEIRLAASLSVAQPPLRWRAVVLGEGDWRIPTERRPVPVALSAGDRLEFHADLAATVTQVADRSGRLIELEFQESLGSLWSKFYRAGRLVQYSHLGDDLEIWDGQTPFAGAPVSLEPPSAAFPLTWGLVARMEARRVEFVSLTHAAGLSSTGDPELDRELPFPEPYWIPARTAEVVNRALRTHGATDAKRRRVIAIGTSVSRALESSALESGEVRTGEGLAKLRMTPTYLRRVVTGIVSGFHDVGTSHLELLGGFLNPSLLAEAYREAEARGYLAHEFGDSMFIEPALLAARYLEGPAAPGVSGSRWARLSRLRPCDWLARQKLPTVTPLALSWHN